MIWLAFCLALLVVPPIIQCHQINRRRDENRASIASQRRTASVDRSER